MMKTSAMKTILYPFLYLASVLSVAGSTLLTQSTWQDSVTGVAGRTTVVTSNGSNLTPWYLVSTGTANASQFIVVDGGLERGKYAELQRVGDARSAAVSFDRQSLVVGESLVVDLTVRYNQQLTDSLEVLRLALYDSSGGTPLPAGDGSRSGAGYAGYSFNVGVDGTTRIRERNGVSNTNFGSGAGDPIGLSTAPLITSENSIVDTRLSLIISRISESSMELEILRDGVSFLKTTHESSAYTAFDTFVLSNFASAGHHVQFSDFSITLIPEGSTYALAFSVMLGVVWMVRRRKVRE